MAHIPSDGQIRNLLDGLQPSVLAVDFAHVHERLKPSGQWSQFVDHAGTILIALDGLTFFSSKKIQCPECLKRQESYFHRAVTPVMVKPDGAHVLPLMPEFVVPQDGAEKQDCERNAAKRWLHKYQEYQAQTQAARAASRIWVTTCMPVNRFASTCLTRHVPAVTNTFCASPSPNHTLGCIPSWPNLNA
jgi:hypothetical protein